MKKLMALLLAAIMVLTLGACVKEGPVAATKSAAPGEELPQENQVYTEPDPEDTQPNIYYLNHDPAMEGPWKTLAQRYKDETGIEVRVITAAPQYYAETLAEALEKNEVPTLFYCANPLDLADICYDITGAQVCLLLKNGEALVSGGKTIAIPVASMEDGALVWNGEAGYWCINGTATQLDAQATLIFLNWALTVGAETLFAES